MNQLKCNKCSLEKASSEFRPWKNTPRGFSYSCRECLKKYDEGQRRVKGQRNRSRVVGDEKYCGICDKMIHISGFGKDKARKSGLTSRCLKCTKIQKQEWRAKNYTTIKNKARWDTIKKKYNLTEEQYNQMLIDQVGLCWMCDKQFNGQGWPFVDHCHQTNKIRGLAHNSCNIGVGVLGDTWEAVLHIANTMKKNAKS